MTTPYLSHLGVQVPAGWVPSEAMAATRPDGRAALQVRCLPTGAVDADDVAARHGEALAEVLVDYAVHSVDHVVTTGGARAILRRAEAGPSDQRMAHAVLYTVSRPWAYVAHVWGPSDEADAFVDLLRDVTPVGLGPAPTPPALARQSSTAAPAPAREAFTVEELVAVAEACGALSFLGYDRRLYAGLTRDKLDLVVRGAARSLLARRVLEVDGEGRLGVATDRETTFGVALRHDQWVQATAKEGTATNQASWAVRGRDGVALMGSPLTNFRLEAFVAAELVGRVETFVGLAAASPGVEAVAVPAGALDAVLASGEPTAAVAPLVDRVGAVSRVVRVRHLVRTGGAVRGGEETWLAGATNAWRVVRPPRDEANGTVVLEPVGPDALAFVRSQQP